MRSKVVRPLLVAAGVFAMVAGAILPAAALDFTYQQSTGFLLGSQTSTAADGTSGIEFNGATVAQPIANAYMDIGWGARFPGGANPAGSGVVATSPFDGPNEGDRSAMRLVGLTGTITVGGPAVQISSIYHKNTTIIDTAPRLTSVTIRSLLELTDSIPPFADPDDIPIAFTETQNVEPCGPINPAGTVCDDRFAILGAGDITESLFFTHNGDNFRIDFTIVRPDFNTIDGEPNQAFLGADGFFYSGEGGIGELQVWMSIVQLVPAPSSLLLLGLGLVGSAIAARRRISA